VANRASGSSPLVLVAMTLLALYVAFSLVVTSICLGKAYVNTQNVAQMLAYLFTSKFLVLVLTNASYTILFLFGKLVQYIFFGKLREQEGEKMCARLLKYILFKIVFVGAILEIPHLRELLIWIAWFSVLGFLRIFSLLARDRFGYLATYMPAAPLSVHVRVLTLLFIISCADLVWFSFCLSVFGAAGISVVLLMTFECLTLLLDTLQTVGKYVIHLVDRYWKEGLWESRSCYTYYTEFLLDTCVLVTTLGHYLHIYYLHGVSLSLIDVVLFLHMRLAFLSLAQKIVNHRNYLRMSRDMDERYHSVSEAELAEYNDSCAICLMQMASSAKKLPCGHIFHGVCLRSWLERRHSCPTCRRSLIPSSTTALQQRSVGGGWFRWLHSLRLSIATAPSASSPLFEQTEPPPSPVGITPSGS